jgi:microcystin-dependent protein
MSIPDPEEPLRPARRTPNLDLPVPGDAAPADAPTDIGELADAIDALGAAGFIGWNPGDVKWSASAAPPTGWLLCNGQAISRTVYSALFAAIGTNYGVGDGVGTFNLPNFSDTFPIGVSGGRPRGTRGGVAAVALSAAQSGCPGGSTGWQSGDHAHHVAGGSGYDWPDHDHGVGYWNNTLGAGQQPGSVMGEAAWVGRTTGVGARHTHDISLWSGGVSANHTHAFGAQNAAAAHENLPPFVAVNVFIKT